MKEENAILNNQDSDMLKVGKRFQCCKLNGQALVFTSVNSLAADMLTLDKILID